MKLYKTKKDAKEDNARIFSSRVHEKEIIKAGSYEYAVKYRIKPRGIISPGEGYLYRWEYA